MTLDVAAARSAIAPYVVRTPLMHDIELSERAGYPVHLKLENLQVTGSFKVRGAANRMSNLSADQRTQGVVACSSGNHGRAVAYVAKRLGISATVCVPEWVDPVKLDAMRSDGARVELAGDTYDEAEARAAALHADGERAYVHPFDDPWVIAGQATLGAEILEDLPAVRRIVVPLSGGGLVSGIAYAAKALRPDLTITAVSAERASVMMRSVKAGRPLVLDEEPTLANALSGGIGLANRHTFEMVKALVDEHVLVSEREIARAMRFGALERSLLVEGGGAVGLAALLAGKLSPDRGRPPPATVVVLSGGNVALRELAGSPQEPSPAALR